MIKTICSEKLRVSIDTVGSCLTSVYDITTQREMLWQKDVEIWDNQDIITFPVIDKPTYFINGVEYACDIKHGCVRDKEFIVVSTKNNALTLRFIANEETYRQYPFHFSLTVDFKVKGTQLHVSYTVANIDNAKMPYYIGGHPGFRAKNGVGEFLFDKYEVPTVYLIEEGSLYKKHKFGKIKSIYIDKDIMKRYATLIFCEFRSKKYTLITEDTDYVVRSDAPVVGLWSKPFGGEYICIEPWWGIGEEKSMSDELDQRAYVNITDKPTTYSYSVNFLAK